MRLLPLVTSTLFVCSLATAKQQDVSISVIKDTDHPMVSIFNGYSGSIEGFLITVDTAQGGKPLTRIYYDVHSNYKHDIAVVPGTSQQVPLPRVVGQDLPLPTLRAVLFSDGTAWGDDSWVQELLHRRKVLLDRLEEVMGVLQNISAQNLEREDALDMIEKARKARRDATPGATPEERVWNDQVFYMAIKNLQGNPRGNGKIPDLPVTLKRLNRALTAWFSDLQTAQPPLALRPGPNSQK